MTLTRLKQWFCGLTGHTDVLRFDGSELRLRCLNCDHRSPGWDLTDQVKALKTHRVVRFHRRLSEQQRVH